MMKNMTLEAIAGACHGVYHGDGALAGQEVEGIVIDSRQIQPGYLYIPIVGERVDGHSFIPDIFAAGAACTLTEQPLPEETRPYIQVESTRQALKEIAAYYREATDIKVVGVTGSVGKTSTKEMIAAVLGQKYRVLKTEGNFNNEIGLPLTIFQIRPEHEVAVLEMGIDSFGEMTRLSQIAKPDICVLTNIGYCHLENLGDRNGVLRAKTEIFTYLRPEGRVVLNGDDDKLKTIAKVKGTPPVFYGIENQKGAIYADHIKELGLDGISADFHIGAQTISAKIPIPGRHMILNAMAGMAVGQILGMTPEEMTAGITSIQTVSGRNNRIETDVFTILDDCYNANPVSMKAAIDVLSQASGRKAAILGDMFELGKEEEALHAQVGEYAAMRALDVILYVGKLSRAAYDASVRISGGRTVRYFETKEQLFAALPQCLRPGDTVLVKASHGMEFPEIVEWLKARTKADFPEPEPVKQDLWHTAALPKMTAFSGETAEPAKPVPNPVFNPAPSAVKKSRANIPVMLLGLLAAALSCLLIGDTLYRHNVSMQLSYYFVLLAFSMVTILCGFFRESLFRICRGLCLLGLIEVLLIVNYSVLNSMLFGNRAISGITSWVYLLWFFAAACWMLAEGLKALLLPESGILLFFAELLNVFQIVLGLSNIFLQYDYYVNQVAAVAKVDFWKLGLTLAVYGIYVLIGLAHLILSPQERKDKRKKDRAVS